MARRLALTTVMLGVLVLIRPVTVRAGDARVIEILADKDNHFKVPGQSKPVITLKAGETVRLRITARKSAEWDKDGMVHSFTIVSLHDQGWDLMLKEGIQEFVVTAPAEAGTYRVQCTVKCGTGHKQMKMKVIVTP